MTYIYLLISVAGSKGCGKSSLIFTLSRGLFPDPEWLPGRFEGWSIPAAAMPKELFLNELNSKNKATTKPYLVNLTFWEDRPRLNMWEKSLSKRQQLEEQTKKEEEEKSKVSYC